MAEAYIASLTAEPVYQERRFISKRNSTVEYWAEVDKSTFGYIHESQRRVVYTAPPVPVVKVPGISELMGNGEALPSVRDVLIWDGCISAVKRLNGLGE